MGTKLEARALDAVVSEAIRERILSGELRPGDPLVEAQLSAEFGISKTPVREALIALGRDGLVDQVPYHVTRVAAPVSEDVRQACEVRGWLEGDIAAQASVAADRDEVCAALQKSIDRSRGALKAGDIHGYTEAVEAFSDLLLEHSGNRFAVEFVQRLRNILALTASVAQRTAGRRERSIDEHEAILAAISSGDPDRARAATRTHMESIESDAMRALAELADAAGAAD
ncbi:MAG: GntR family transcriptional regulator [Solirubrobacterales bacterium]